MHITTETTRGYNIVRILERLFFLVPFALLGIMAMTWLRVGIDLPFGDDWRDYLTGTKGSFSPGYLFLSANDTMYPVGKVLDSVAERLLDGNSVAYQFITMVTVLGLILWFQWLLLSTLTEDKFVAACCFAATVFALQVGTYWGIQNLAYHQAIPVVCMLATAYLVSSPRKAGIARYTALFLLGLIAGFSYISGSFPFLAGALILIGLGFVVPGRRDLAYSGTALALAGVISSAAQAYVIVVRQGGSTHRPDAPWVSPLSSDFWLYTLGKIARSLALPASSPGLSLTITLLAVGGMFLLIGRELVRTFRRRETTDMAASRLVVTLFLGCIIAIYLAMVSAARSNLGVNADASLLDKFASGLPRFHFFWATVIWPWALALFLCWASEKLSKPIGRVIGGVAAGVILVFAASANQLDYRGYFHYTSTIIRGEHGIACIQRELLTSNRIRCPRISQSDLTKAYAFAVLQRSSFIRSFPPTIAQFNPSPERNLFTLSQAPLEVITIKNAIKVVPAGQVLEIDAEADIQMILVGTIAANRCQTMLVRAVVDGAESKAAEFFFTPVGAKGFSGKNRAVARYTEGAVEISASSSSGFESVFRFDPITQAGSIRLNDLTVRCLVFRS